MSTYWNFDKPVYENKRYVAEYAFTMPEDCSNYAVNNIENYNTITSLPEKYLTADYSKVVNGRYLFAEMAKCDFKTINFNFKNLNDPTYMFYKSNISFIPNLDVSKCNTLDGLFRDCNNLKIAEMKKINISDIVTRVYNIFWGCKTLTSVLSFFDTSKITSLGGLFSGCISLEEICYIETKRNVDFHDFFAQSKIKGLEWEINLQCATNISGMLGPCSNLLDGGITLINVPRTLDLSNIGCATSKYTVKNYIETALDPSEVVD